MPLIHESYDSLPCMFSMPYLAPEIAPCEREGKQR
jgi:hypothetical protein